ncbi:MAG: hypothetical protein ABSA13_11830 [Beijerinckiaceae bacterium]|jgi:hypothetical protein
MIYANTLESSNRSVAPKRRKSEITLAQRAIFYGQLTAALGVIFVIAVTLAVQGLWSRTVNLIGHGAIRQQRRGAFRTVW